MADTNPIIIVQGGQWGSEAKGHIAAYICETEKVDIAVRTGATNAGHTVMYKRDPDTAKSLEAAMYFDGCGHQPVKMQQLPVGWVNPATDLVLGAGSLIDPKILAAECELITRLTGSDVRKRLYIDYRAGVHRPIHAERSAASGRQHRIGATGKGCSEALIDRIRGRGDDYRVFGRTSWAQDYQVMDTARALNDKWDAGAKILLEGTQGTLLDLYLGPYPYTTHKQTTPAVWMAEAGLSPALPTDIVLVVRTYPIRVAGNSGPMSREISWPDLARAINGKRAAHSLPPIVDDSAIQTFEESVRHVVARGWQGRVPRGSNGLDQHTWGPDDRKFYSVAVSEIHKEALDLIEYEDGHRTPGVLPQLLRLFEMTTVTKKLRRVAMLSGVDLIVSALQCRPHRVALTFMNYEYPEHWYVAPTKVPDTGQLVGAVERACRAPVSLLSFGPASSHVVRR